MNAIPQETKSRETILAKFGDVPLKFSSYFKFSFVFRGNLDQYHIEAEIGGSADDIYRLAIGRDSVITLNQQKHSSALLLDSQGDVVWSE